MGLVVYVLLQIEGTRYHIGSALLRWIIPKLWIKQREIQGVQPESINPAIKALRVPTWSPPGRTIRRGPVTGVKGTASGLHDEPALSHYVDGISGATVTSKGVTALVRTAQGSATVAMITAVGIVGGLYNLIRVAVHDSLRSTRAGGQKPTEPSDTKADK